MKWFAACVLTEGWQTVPIHDFHEFQPFSTLRRPDFRASALHHCEGRVDEALLLVDHAAREARWQSQAFTRRFGRSERIRTSDPLVPKKARQLARLFCLGFFLRFKRAHHGSFARNCSETVRRISSRPNLREEPCAPKSAARPASLRKKQSSPEHGDRAAGGVGVRGRVRGGWSMTDPPSSSLPR